MTASRLAALLAAMLTCAAQAQDEMPAIGGLPQPTAPARTAEPRAGTTIVGEQESPIGLYIMPWRDAEPEPGMDRPARLLQEKLLPLDEAVFVRQIEYHTALSKALKQKGVVTPQER
ncbi:hypothetical protein SAMN04488120_10512 [Fontimonas thermophila]|uniref:Uncharacterized protein n=1 Tax=Fontimonas thermophila TaxID=1076937 RepID=A0A1I2IZF1_9GAMM|nr:hypothetical protein [Fontimonas thermophila]SFF46983.1 hypothetical protein SAMN04488120_10512 [Fontimonas thermophila]